MAESAIYANEENLCECWKCELASKCNIKDKYQRLPRTVPGALGLCKKLHREATK